MKIILKRAPRKKTEFGYEFGEDPITIGLSGKFPDKKKINGCCGSSSCECSEYKKRLITIPFGKYYSECEVKNNPCIPDYSLTYDSGSLAPEEVKCKTCH